MKLIQLQAFKEIMDTGTVTGASKSLSCSQPRVSRLISELEEDIGFPLFRREKQRLHITTEGKIFYKEAQRILLGINSIEQAAEDILNQRETCLRILTQSHIAHGLLSRVFGELDQVAKNTRFNLVIKPRKELTKWLGGHQFDLALTALPARHPLVRQQKLVSIKLLLALPKDSPLAQKQQIEINDLADIPIIALPKGLPMRHRLIELFEKVGIIPNIRIETPTVFSACQMVSRGLGVTLTGPFTASLFTEDNFVLRPVVPNYIVDYGVLYLKQEQPRRLVRQFVDVAIKVAEDINSEVINRL